MFGQGTTYSRGGLTLHMLRRMLGDNVFFGGLSKYLKANQYQPVATADLIKALSASAGRDLTPWFDQWVFRPGHPTVDWTWSYDAAGKYTVLHLKQTQDTSDGTPIYNMPLRVAIIAPVSNAKSTVTETTVTFDKADQEVRIPCATKPDSVIVDPGHDLVMEMKATGPAAAELPAQLRYAPSYQDRLRAARLLANGPTGKDEATVRMLASALSAETSDAAAAGILGLLTDLKKENLRPLFRAQAASKNPTRRAAALAALAALPATPQDVALLRQNALSDTGPTPSSKRPCAASARWTLPQHGRLRAPDSDDLPARPARNRRRRHSAHGEAGFGRARSAQGDRSEPAAVSPPKRH